MATKSNSGVLTDTEDSAPENTGLATTAPAPAGELAHSPVETLNDTVREALSDLDIPKLNLIQKSSDIKGDVGALILDKKHVLADAEQPIPAIVLFAMKQWKEDVPYESTVIGKMAKTLAEANRLAETSEYEVIEFAELFLLFKAPDGVDDEVMYPLPIGTGRYALGKLHVAKDAYRCTYKRLNTFARFNPNIPVHSRIWEFRSEFTTKGKYTFYVPTLTQTRDTPDPAVAEFIPTLLGFPTA
jgi:hypothetical protein